MKARIVTAIVALVGTLWLVPSGSAQAGGSCFRPASTKSSLHVDLRENCFNPTVLLVAPGATVTWTNREAVSHTVTGLGVSWGVAEPLTEGQSATFQFDKPGIYPYACVLHYGMVGSVVVGDGALKAAPASAVTEVLPDAPAPAASPVVKIVRVASRPVASNGAWPAVAVAGWAVAVATALAFALVGVRRKRNVPSS